MFENTCSGLNSVTRIFFVTLHSLKDNCQRTTDNRKAINNNLITRSIKECISTN